MSVHGSGEHLMIGLRNMVGAVSLGTCGSSSARAFAASGEEEAVAPSARGSLSSARGSIRAFGYSSFKTSPLDCTLTAPGSIPGAVPLLEREEGRVPAFSQKFARPPPGTHTRRTHTRLGTATTTVTHFEAALVRGNLGEYARPSGRW